VYKKIYPAIQPPDGAQLYITGMADSWEEAKEINTNDKADVKVYMNGYGLQNGAGAAAILYKGGKQIKALRYHLVLTT
jgi:hypothetical protein